MGYRVAINGFGRIGRDYLRCVLERGLLGRGIDVVAINDLWDAATRAGGARMGGVLQQGFGSKGGCLTTVRGYTNDQGLLDTPHKDLRRARSGAVNIIPTSTGAAKAIGQVLPQLIGKLDGVALRVPVENGSLCDLTCQLSVPVTADQVNEVFLAASRERLDGILRYTTKPVVSRDLIGDPASCVFDASLTQANGTLAKVLGWYDNEWGYTSRLVDLSLLFATAQA